MKPKPYRRFAQSQIQFPNSPCDAETVPTNPDQFYLQENINFGSKLRLSQHKRNQVSFCELPPKNGLTKNLQGYSFNEQWQNKQKKLSQNEEIQILVYKNSTQTFVSFCTMLCFTFTIWLANVEFFFGLNRKPFIPNGVYSIPLCIIIIDFLRTFDFDKALTSYSRKRIVVEIFKPVYCFIYLLLKAISVQFSKEGLWLAFQLPCLVLLYAKSSEFYKAFRLMSLSKRYEYHFKAFDLIFSLMMVAHIVAIILYQVSLCGEEVTWRTELNLQLRSSLINYIYSFYFGCTTILTVGYGDITPTNQIEIVVVCFVELFGIAIFAYLINQIGYNLSSLRKDRQLIERDLSILQKCREYYGLNQELVTKARSNLLSSAQAVNRLKPDEERALILKFNEPLRKELMENSTLAVVKSCIFLLCRWSKQFQNKIAQSLVSCLYMPGQQMIQLEGKQRIYIIKIGKVNFYRQQKGNNREAQKAIKSLSVDLQTEVSNNSFGYTAVIGRRATDLEAFCSDFTSAYYIDRENFQRCIRQSLEDKEYYHELKEKIEQSTFPEALEIPALNCRRYHFNPSKYFLIKRKNLQKNQGRNKRKGHQRWHRNRYIIKLQQSEVQKQEEIMQIREAYANQKEDIGSFTDLDNAGTITLESTLALGLHEIFNLINALPKTALEFEEVAKQYKNFYPEHNLESVIKKYERKDTHHQRNVPSAKNKVKKSKFALQRQL